MNAHFKDSFAHGFAVAKIAMFGRTDAKSDTGAPDFIFQAGEPIVEFLGALKGIHRPHCIRSDTGMQSRWGYFAFRDRAGTPDSGASSTPTAWMTSDAAKRGRRKSST